MRELTVVLLMLLPLISGASLAQDSEQDLFSMSGNVYDSEGDLAGDTSIRVIPMDSIWSTDGSYSFDGIPPGEHTVRAYFMDDGHTVVYRKISIQSNLEIDWHVDKNWVTFKQEENEDYDSVLVELIQTSESLQGYSNIGEFGPHDIGGYYTLMATYDDHNDSTQYVHFRMEAGSSSNPSPNHFQLSHGHNSIYGFLSDLDGNPATGVTVSAGDKSSMTNSDGFYLLQNLKVGTTHNVTATYWGNELMQPMPVEITSNHGWTNLTATADKNMPEFANFSTQIITSSLEEVDVHWSGGNYTDYYSLYLDGDLVYRGEQESFVFDPLEPGNYYFSVEASNSNGSKRNPQELRVVILPIQSDSDLWSTGMSWNYTILHTPYYQQNKTYTTIGSESIHDAYGNLIEAYLLRISDEEYEEGEKAFRWVDKNNLMTTHTYWVDSPSVSSYYQEGFLGWEFTDSSGNSVNPLEYRGVEEINLHFNRTNIIGVPGHPNGYEDTTNKVQITQNYEIETIAGIFKTTYLRITDDNDGVVSWEMWYNETVRNWVKVIDRIPGSHSDVVSWELTSFEVPVTPQFITEDGSKFTDDDFAIEWANFQGASSYELTENGKLIYAGQDTNFSMNDRADGQYTYGLRAIMDTGTTIDGEMISIRVSFVLQPPIFLTDSHSIEGTTSEVSWSPVEGEALYTVLVMYGDGTSSIAYEGIGSSITVDILEPGINRIRVMATLSDGVTSEYSDSIFITTPEETEEADSLPFQSSIATLMILSSALLFARRRDFG